MSLGLYLLVRGYVIVHNDGESGSTCLEAPCYFGERAVFFGQKPAGRFVSGDTVECFVLAGEDIRALVQVNSTFSRGFANVFQHKHRIFAGDERYRPPAPASRRLLTGDNIIIRNRLAGLTAANSR